MIQADTTQLSLTKSDGKIYSLSYQMHNMLERINKHAEHLDQGELQVSEVEDKQVSASWTHKQQKKTLLALQAKAEDWKVSPGKISTHCRSGGINQRWEHGDICEVTDY
ncbi:hypothetical protein NDU88_006803 [Pleurodeles waltl]|uniref:Uncharacterized protein n=1 Tax=Pleurodeles waltl TaxID=8319 RepID=A0AAV7VNT5_PLEWA|nr:hypothetical protein NDU88_006803 [Pleurodeles waltl]